MYGGFSGIAIPLHKVFLIVPILFSLSIRLHKHWIRGSGAQNAEEEITQTSPASPPRRNPARGIPRAARAVRRRAGEGDGPRTRVERIAAETSGITADTALRLGKALGTSADLWLNLQRRYDLETAQRAIGRDLAKIERVTKDAAE